jgi:hypothetical protein
VSRNIVAIKKISAGLNCNGKALHRFQCYAAGIKMVLTPGHGGTREPAHNGHNYRVLDTL